MGKEAGKPMKKAGHDKNCTCTKGAEISSGLTTAHAQIEPGIMPTKRTT